jgi:hypothetical protein
MRYAKPETSQLAQTLIKSASLLITAWSLAACGGSNTPAAPAGLVIGYVQTGAGSATDVYMNPAPPAVAPPVTPTPGASPAVTIYQTSQFASGAYDYSLPGNAYTPTMQVVYGTVSGVNYAAVQLEVYAYTTAFYIQPLTGTYVQINSSNGTWVCSSAAGTIHALLVRTAYIVPPFTSLPPVDGVNILAEI